MTKNPPLAGKPDISHWDFPADSSAAEVYLNLLEELQKHFIDIQRDGFSLPGFDAFAAKTLEAFVADRWGLFRVFHDGRVYSPSTASHSLNVALVAYLYSQANSWNPEASVLLVRAALLHDVGMLFLPPELLLKNGKLTDRERELMESHPSASFERVRQWGESYEATQVALQHHEEWGGQGYPAKLTGDRVHPWARIAAVAIQFVARVTQRRYRNSLVGYEAIKLLIKDQGTRFDPVAVKGLVRTLGLNPPGSILLLSDGSIARVVEMTKDNLLRPEVRLLIDSFGTVFRDDKGPLLNLNDTPKVFIARPVNFQDLLEAREHQGPG
jgi:HD-GYP domain-containing protein (c-di-GMP phosphodiesterase class II)